MLTFAQFKKKVFEKAFPTGEPDTLTSQLRDDVVAALIDVQTYCRFYRAKNINVYPFCSTLLFNGATVVTAPRGKIQRVYTLPSDKADCPIYYDFIENFDEFLNWLHATRPTWLATPSEGLPSLPYGFEYASEVNNKGYRFSWGSYSIHNGKLYLGQRIESDERIFIDWDGVKRKYAEEDIIPISGDFEDDGGDEGIELIDVVVPFVLSRYRFYEEDYANQKLHLAQFSAARAEIIWRHKNDSKPKPEMLEKRYNQPKTTGVWPFAVEPCCVADAASDSDDVVFAIVNDFDGAEAAGSQLATMIESWGASFVASAGDIWNNDTAGDTVDELDSTTGQYFRKFFFPYRGTSGDQYASEQLIFTGIGNHERTPAARLPIVKDFFNLPPIKRGGQIVTNPGYYEVQKGIVHFFFIDSDSAADEGNTANSSQAAYILGKLRASTAKWKIVFVHTPPYYSANTADGGFANLRWDFTGADLIVSGHIHNYERLSVNSIPYIVSGMGGHAIDNFGSQIRSDSQVRYNAEAAALRLTANCSSLLVECISIGGTTADSFTIEK